MRPLTDHLRSRMLRANALTGPMPRPLVRWTAPDLLSAGGTSARIQALADSLTSEPVVSLTRTNRNSQE